VPSNSGAERGTHADAAGAAPTAGAVNVADPRTSAAVTTAARSVVLRITAGH
jgi:hypothetical protein